MAGSTPTWGCSSSVNHNPPKKTGLNCGSMTCPTGGAPNINYGKNNYGKNNYGKTGQSLISQEKSIMEKMELWKKKGSDHFRDILNPYGEKPNYGKIGRRRRLSKLNVFFFHNSVGDHMVIYPRVWLVICQE